MVVQDLLTRLTEQLQTLDSQDAISILDSIVNQAMLHIDLISKKETSQAFVPYRFVYDILKSANIVVFEWTLEPDIPTRFVSENISQFGYQPEDFYHGHLKDYWNFIHPDDREMTKNRVYAARNMFLNDFRHHYRIQTALGQTRWVEERIVYQRDAANQMISEKGILLDITERKLLEMQLEENKRRYELLYDHASVMMMTFNRQGQLTSVNHKTKAILGYTNEEFLNMTIEGFSGLKSVDEPFCPKNYDQLKEENTVICKDGTALHLMLSYTCVTLANNELEIELIAQDITGLREEQHKMTYINYHDSLTDLYNRNFMDKKIKELYGAHAWPFSIIVADMNGLKDVNDLLGHDAGDHILIQMADILRHCCRDGDYISRYGGDEFVLLLPHCDDQVVKRIIQSVKRKTFGSEKSLLLPSVAMGSATAYSHNETILELFKKADDAMYKDKHTRDSQLHQAIGATLSIAIEKNLPCQAQHIERVSRLVYSMATNLALPQTEIERIQLAATLHDVGKLGLPKAILSKKGKLSVKEHQLFRTHSEIGFKILQKHRVEEEISRAVLHHHEWYDGSGYPNGLAGDEIPYYSRIISIADAYDAMIQKVNYGHQMTPQDALQELRRVSGIQFDPDLVDVFVSLIKQSNSETKMNLTKRT